MAYRSTDNPDTVFCEDTSSWVARGTWMWEAYEAWKREGNVATPYSAPPPYQPYTPEHFRFIRDSAAEWLLAKAKERGYDSVESCVSYYNSTRARYQREARAMVAWRDAVYGGLEDLAANPPANIETWEQVRVLLPQPEAYDFPDTEVLLPGSEIDPVEVL